MAQVPSRSSSLTRRWLWPLLLILLAVVFGLPTLDEPFGRDEGVYAAFADILHQGGLPYVNAWDHKPPGIYYVYEAAFAVLGRSMLAMRLFDIFFILVMMAAVYALGKRVFDATAGKAAAFLIAFVYFCDTHYNHRPESDSVGMLPAALAALCVVRAVGPRRAAWVAAAGFFGGICIIFKVTAGITVVAFGVFLLIEDLCARQRALRIAGEAAAYLLGIGAAIGPLVLYAWKAGFLAAMIQVVIEFNSQYYVEAAGAAGGVIGMLKYILQTTSWWPYLILPATVGAVAGLLHRRREEWAVVVLGAACLAAVLVQGKYWAYHWLAMFPAWAVLAGATYVQAARRISWRGLSPAQDGRNLLLALAMVTLAMYALATWGQNAADSIAFHMGKMSAARFYGGEITPGAYQERFGRYQFGDFSYWADLQVAAYLQQHTGPEDRVFIWGFEPLIYFLADRTPASRFLMSHPLNAHFALREVWRRELVETLERRPPLYFIVVKNDVFELQSVDSATQLLRFPALHEFVERHYRPEAAIEDFTLLRRIDSGASPSRSPNVE